jgi:2-C-methyl-D-erythritol 4-phosphate cytidylyltransferase
MTIGVILLAGGTGSRMQAPIPKQFLLLNQKPLISYSFELFLKIKDISEIVIVCDAKYHSMFVPQGNPLITFAAPGERRQDSVYNGLKAFTTNCSTICVHDGVRPFITETLVQRVIQAGQEHGAATVAMPVKFTIKECDKHQMAVCTPDRSKLWEIQTPQVIRRELFNKGFDLALSKNATVTDDVSLVELLGHPVKIVEGSYSNLKITTPDDMALAEFILKR